LVDHFGDQGRYEAKTRHAEEDAKNREKQLSDEYANREAAWRLN